MHISKIYREYESRVKIVYIYVYIYADMCVTI